MKSQAPQRSRHRRSDPRRGSRPEGRKAASKWQNRSRLRGVAVIGASPLIRGLIQLIGNALSLFSKRTVPLRFFANQSDAVAWIADRRHTGRPAGP